MRNFFENLKTILALVFCGLVFIFPVVALLVLDFEETTRNILIALLSIGAFIIVWYIYQSIKTRIEINFIIDDINKTYKRGFNEKRIRDLVYKKTKFFYKFIRIEPLLANPQLNGLLYKRTKHISACEYTYNIVNLCNTFADIGFSYELYEHCEKRIMDEHNTEHRLMRKCLNNTLMAYPHLLKEYGCLKFLCQELLKIDYWEEKNSHLLDRMIANVENARHNIKTNFIKYKSDEIELDELCDKYIDELKNYWEEYSK